MRRRRLRRRYGHARKTPAQRLFAGVYPTGIVYADRSREKHGDYARCGYLSFRTLVLELEPDCPKALRPLIEADAAKLQAKRGEKFEVSTSGQYVILGGK